MIPFGKILKFKSYDAEKLDRMKHDLALSAPSSFWQYCNKYYSVHAKRDPYIEELRLLDRIFLSLQAEAGLLVVHELYTNDAVVAETYADMMQKRRELTGGSAAPVTLGEIFNLSNAYLLRAGKSAPRDLPLIFSAETDSEARLLATSTAKKKETDLFVLLSPDTECVIPAADLNGLMADPAFTTEIKSIQRVSTGGVLLALLKECDAFEMDLDVMCDESTPNFAIALTRSMEGKYLIRISTESRDQVSSVAQGYGYHAQVVANADEGGTVTVFHRQNELFRLETSFLKTLFPQQKITAKLQDEKKGTLLPAKAFPAPPRALTLGGFSCNQTSVAPTDAFFTNAFYTALLAVIRQCLCGSDYADQRLSVELRIPKRLDEKASGAILSTAIGLYRLQAELGLLSSAPCLTVDKEIVLPSLTVFTCGDGEPLPEALQNENATAYLVRITATENGLPDFDALRKLLAALCTLRREGALCSACVNVFENTPDAPISILLESANPLENTDFEGLSVLKDEELEDFLKESKKIFKKVEKS